MGGIFTQTRDIFQKGHVSKTRPSWKMNYRLFPNGTEDSSFLQTRLYRQTTVSYRDRDPSGATELDPRQLLLSKPDIQRPYDRGHEFSTDRGSLRLSHGRWSVGRRSGGNAFWQGPLMIDVPEDNIPGQLRVGDFDPINLQYGTKAINQSIPTKSDASVTQLLAELKQDLPRGLLTGFVNKRGPLGSERSSELDWKATSQGVGSDYLNYVFGIAPTISDLLKICNVVVNFDDRITQYLRDNGQFVRRRFDFPVTRSSRSIARSNNVAMTGTDLMVGNSAWIDNFVFRREDIYGTAELSEERSERYYFTGAFQYYLEGVSSPTGWVARGAQIARKILGIDGLTVDLAYQLFPFSWLLDWFVNVGDLIQNSEAFNRDNLVIRWGYLMRETRISRTYTHSGAKFLTGSTGPVHMFEDFVQKRRVKATPFGFGLNPNSFTESQWAILIALGLTKGGRTLL